MQMTDGDLIAVTDTPSLFGEEAGDGDGATLREDVRCILAECSRDRGLAAFRDGVRGAELDALAAEVARRLAPRIGGRYVTKRDARALRDREVWLAFNGRNRLEVMRQFGISKALFYNILSRKPRGNS
jgi:Mor family transcriptional regulator